MPISPLKPCASPRCSARALPGARWCAVHRPLHVALAVEAARAHDARRGTAAERGYDGRWRKARATFLARRRWRCAGYQVENCTQPASVVDHKTPHRGNQVLFWDTANWQPLCKRCHDRKTATEDGGFRGAQSSPQSAPSAAPALGIA